MSCTASSHSFIQSKYACTGAPKMKAQGGWHTGFTQLHALRPCIHRCLAHALYMKAMFHSCLGTGIWAGLSACLNQVQSRLCSGPQEQKAVDGFGVLRMTRLTQVGTYSWIFPVCSQALKTQRTKQEQSQRQNETPGKQQLCLSDLPHLCFGR